MKEALCWEKLDDNRAHCYLCAHHCHINDGRQGICPVRENLAGTLYSQSYGRMIAQARRPDREEAALPLPARLRRHTQSPRQAATSAASGARTGRSPRRRGRRAARALRRCRPQAWSRPPSASAARSISYTYTEPTMFFEYASTALGWRGRPGCANVFVTNGFMTGEMLDVLYPLLDAANVDLKAFRDEYVPRPDRRPAAAGARFADRK